MATDTNKIPPQAISSLGAIRKVDNFANVAAETGLRNGERLQIGYGDGRIDSDIWVYNSTSTATDNSTSSGPGTVLDGPAGTGRFLRQYKGPAALEWWGAVGDGTTDSYFAFVAARDSGVPQISGDPTATYLITQTFKMTVANQQLDLRGATVKQAATAPWVEEAPDDTLIEISASGVSVINGTLEGNGSADDVGAVFATGVANLKFQDLEIKNFGDYGLFLFTCTDSLASDIRCTNNHITGAAGTSKGNVAFNTCTNCQANDITITESLGKGLAFTGSIGCTASNIVVTRDTFSVTNPGGDGGIYFGLNSENCTINNVVTKNVHNKISEDVFRCAINGFSMETTGYDVFQLQGAKNFKLSNGTLHAKSPARYAININDHTTKSTDNCEFHNVRIISDSGTQESIQMTQSVGGLGTKFFNCIIEGSQTATSLGTDDCIIVDHTSGSNEWHGCSIKYLGAEAVGTIAMYAPNWKIANSHLETVHAGIEAFIPRAAGLMRSSTVKNNSTTKATIRPLTTASTYEHCSIENDGTYYSARISVLGCRFTNCKFKSNVWTDAAGIEQTTIENCVITGNLIITNSTTNSFDGSRLSGTITNTTAGSVSPGPFKYSGKPGQVTVASATAVPLWSSNGNFTNSILINGSETIAGGDDAPIGIIRHVVFAGALQLTNGTSFKLPGAANITTVANDTAIFRSLGSTSWQCDHYTRAAVAP